jgi:lysyl-tRNA synthetase class 2
MNYKKERINIPVVRSRYDRVQNNRDEGVDSYPSYSNGHLANIYRNLYECEEGETLAFNGRVRLIRNNGKIAFAKIDLGMDLSSEVDELIIQAVSTREDTDNHNKFRKLHIGDIVVVSGIVGTTEAGERSIFVREWKLLSKNIRPLPDKFHGMKDIEERYRQRYVDLISNEKVRENTIIRSKILSSIRNVLTNMDFIEVETPQLHHTKGGASAKAFETHFNALDQDMIMRIAPELYLKRMVVGGLNRVFEIGKNFRNEGIDTNHNPEFTSVEFYHAYTDYERLMLITEEIFYKIQQKVCPEKEFLEWKGCKINLDGFQRKRMTELIADHLCINEGNLYDEEYVNQFFIKNYGEKDLSDDWGHNILYIFEIEIEHRLINPTFVTHYPKSVSPLARTNDENPMLVDRFELFIAGVEFANGFNELADPEDQYNQFAKQIAKAESGDEEAMEMDLDYINALEYGLPPTAGAGIGVDRLCMLFCEESSIKEVIAFPTLKNKQ